MEHNTIRLINVKIIGASLVYFMYMDLKNVLSTRLLPKLPWERYPVASLNFTMTNLSELKQRLSSKFSFWLLIYSYRSLRYSSHFSPCLISIIRLFLFAALTVKYITRRFIMEYDPCIGIIIMTALITSQVASS